MSTFGDDLNVASVIFSETQGKVLGQLDKLPLSCKDYAGIIVMYTGDSTDYYEKGAFYRCDGVKWDKMDLHVTADEIEIGSISGGPTADMALVTDSNGVISASTLTRKELEEIPAKFDTKVDKTTTVNGKPLSGDIVLDVRDIPNAVPNYRKINGYTLANDITLNFEDVGALSESWSENITRNTSRIESLESRMGNAEQELKDQAEHDRQQDGRLDQHDSDLAAVQGRCSSLEGRATEAESRLDANDKKNEQQDSRLTSLESRSADQETRMGRLEARDIEQETRLESLEDRASSAEGRLTSVENKNTQQDGRLTNLEQRATDAEGRLASVEKKNTEQEDRLKSLEGRASSLEGRADSADQDRTKIRQEMSSMKSELLGEIGDAVKTVTVTTTASNGTVSVNGVSDTIPGATSSKAGLMTSTQVSALSTAQSDISSLQSSVSSLQTTVDNHRRIWYGTSSPSSSTGSTGDIYIQYS